VKATELLPALVDAGCDCEVADGLLEDGGGEGACGRLGMGVKDG